MKCGLASPARDEYREAAWFYLQVSPRIAAAFINQIEASVAQIRANPLTWRIVQADVRRYLVKQFPFGIYYTVERDEVVIWAIMHLQRKPHDWRVRRSS